MAFKQIPNLPPVITLAGPEQLELVQAGTSSRVALDQIVSYSLQKNLGLTQNAYVYVGDTAPPVNYPGLLWWNSALGQLFIYYSDSNSTQWVPASPTATGAPPNNEFNVGDFGVLSGNVDNLAALLTAMGTVSAAGGGTLVFGPGTYAFSNEFSVPTGVAFRGVKGSTRFDFSSVDHFTTNTAFIRVEGTYGTDVLLTRDVLPTPSITVHLLPTTTTRSGTTVSATCDGPHNLIPGDIIWVLGTVPEASPGQAVFVTVNPNPLSGGYNTRTTPYVVATTPTTTTFTYTVANTGDTVMTLTFVTVLRAADVIPIASTVGYVVGQTVSVRSNARRQNVTELIRIGELQKIARVINSTWLLLHSEVQDEYLVADQAKIAVANMMKGFSIKNIEVIGKGPNLTAPYGDRGVLCYVCENPEIEDCVFTNVDQININIWDCIGGRVVGNQITFNAADEAGAVTGDLDIQYGIAYSGATTGLLIANNTIFGGRHAIVQSGSGGSTFYGVVRGTAIIGNTLHGQWLGSISTHQNCDSMVVSNNVITGTQAGINVRFGRNTIISNNVITAWDLGIYIYQVHDNLKIHGNDIRASGAPIYISSAIPPQGSSPATNPEPWGPISVTNNTCIGGDRGVYINQATPRSDGMIDIVGNIVKDTKYEAIRVSFGSSTVASDGFIGRVSGNTFYDIGRQNQFTTIPGLQITNMRGGSIDNNIFHNTGLGTTLTAILINGDGTGDGTVSVMDNVVPASMFATETISVTPARQILTDLSPKTLTTITTTIASGVATPKLAGPLLVIDTEGSNPSDDLDTLNAGTAINQRRVLRTANTARAVTVRHGAGNIQTATGQSRLLQLPSDKLELVWTGSAWEEVFYTSHAAAQIEFTGTPVTFDFLATPGTLPGSAVLTRSTVGWTVNSAVVLTSTAINAGRWTYNTSGVLEGLLVEPARTNLTRNNSGTGAVPGTPGTLPTNWLIGGVTTGLTREVVGTGTEDGIPYVDIRFSGTAPAPTSYSIETEARNVNAAATGQTWAAQLYCKLQAGSLTNSTSQFVRINGYNSGGTFTEGTSVVFTPTTASLIRNRVTRVQTFANATTAFVNVGIGVNYLAAPIDITLRIGGGGLALANDVSSPIITTAAAVTRAVDALTLTLANNLYNITTTTLAGTTSKVVSISTGNYVVPTGVSPLRTITATPVS